LDHQQEIEARKIVSSEMEEGLSRSDAIFTTAIELGSINNNSAEFKDQVSERSKKMNITNGTSKFF